MLPWLCRKGFAGPIFATPGTRDLCQVILADSAHVQAEDASYSHRHGEQPSEPLYTPDDIPETMSRFVARDYGRAFPVVAGIEVEYHEAGHILGAASIAMGLAGRQVVFSGDIGPRGRPLMRDPDPPPSAGTAITESTYGDRLHPPLDQSVEELAQAIHDLAGRRGVLMMPVFAVGRTEAMLYQFGELMREGRIPKLPVYLDSPLALEAVAVVRRHLDDLDEVAQALIRQGTDPLTFPSLKLVRTVDESKGLNRLEGPAVIMAGSGMCTGGRIRHHLRNRLANPDDMVLFVGYQAVGTLGRILADGAKQVKLYGEWVQVKAEVRSIGGFSAHADQQGLLGWLKAIDGVRLVILNHGEPGAVATYAEVVKAAGLPAPHVAALYETIGL
jgi:metallo-beta-lactamase family protein